MRCTRLSTALLLGFLAVLPGCGTASDPEADKAAVTTVFEAFYGAMKNADTATAMAQIAEDAVFVEGGSLETRREYETNHLPSDIEFEQAVPGNRTSMDVRVDSDAAWVIATTEYHGEFQGSPLDFASAQLMVLTRQDSGWKIRSIHWSSRRL
jgi:ketosteroid isomerase-like protein